LPDAALAGERERPDRQRVPGQAGSETRGGAGHSPGAGGSISATNNSAGLIRTTVPINLPSDLVVSPGHEYQRLTAWMMYQLQGDPLARLRRRCAFADDAPSPTMRLRRRCAFADDAPEINTNPAWQNQAEKNLP
jgi:hypothetical protein